MKLHPSKLSPQIDSLLKEYAKQFPKVSAYAIYFDKKDEEEHRITIAHFDGNMIDYEKVQALNYFLFKDSIRVFLYSGIESFISQFATMSSEYLEPDLRHSWSLVVSKDTSYIVKGDTYPFINFTLKPTVYFQPPDDSSIR